MTSVNAELYHREHDPKHKCPDCGGPLGYTPTCTDDPFGSAEVCQKCFDDFEGMTIEELIDPPSSAGEPPNA